MERVVAAHCRLSERSCIWDMIHNTIDLISPCDLQPSEVPIIMSTVLAEMAPNFISLTLRIIPV